MKTVACVLRSGPLYTPAWVHRLRRNVAAHLGEHRFACLSDIEVEGVETIPLKHGWPGWWSIVEVFRPGLFTGRVLYLDLADLVVRPLDPFFEGEGFRIARSPLIPAPMHGRFASGLMAFDAGDTEIYDRFAPQAGNVIRRLHGDQEWIEELRPDAATFDQHMTAGFRGECVAGPPEDARVIFVHGQPKPHQISAGWFRELWDA